MRDSRPLALAAALLVSACDRSAGPVPDAPRVEQVERVDGRSDDSLDQSLDAMRSRMTPQQIEEFTDALLRIASRDSARILRESNGDPAAFQRALRERLDGLSAAEILAEGAEGH
jgi:hypothetical protein